MRDLCDSVEVEKKGFSRSLPLATPEGSEMTCYPAGDACAITFHSKPWDIDCELFFERQLPIQITLHVFLRAANRGRQNHIVLFDQAAAYARLGGVSGRRPRSRAAV